MKKTLIATILSISLSGCGGSGTDSEGQSSSLEKSYLVPTQKIVHLSLAKEENIIAASPCTKTTIYNDKNVFFDNGKKFEHGKLPAGEYKVLFTEFYTKYSDSISILYSLSNKVVIPSLPTSEKVIIKARDSRLYVLSLEKDTLYMITQQTATATIFNATLTPHATSNPLYPLGTIPYTGDDAFELKKGVYYIVIDPFYCNKGGTVKFTKLN